jgi:hypothetical protein
MNTPRPSARLRCVPALGALLGALLGAFPVQAQSREPLCVPVATRRLVSAPFLAANGSDRLVAQPFRAVASDGAAFVVALRDPERSLRVGPRRALARTVASLELQSPERLPDHVPGLTVLRVDRALRVVGDGAFVQDPVSSAREGETFPPGIPVSAAIASGVLVAQHIAGDVYVTLVGATPGALTSTRVAQAPPAATRAGRRGFVWITITPHTVAGQVGAALLAGTDEGEVVAVTLGPDGARVGDPVLWSQRVGGAMQLLPLPPDAPPAALLERPVRGTATNGQPAREQMLVRLGATLEPAGDPERVGLGPYEVGATMRGDTLVLSQWVDGRGFALVQAPLREGRLALEAPRIWTTAPFEGLALGHTMRLGPQGIVYDLALHGDDVAGGLHGYLTFVPPSGAPFPRRDVVPLRARVIAPPQLVPAEDGVVAVMATYDELGGGVDAVHLRCDMVTLPDRR